MAYTVTQTYTEATDGTITCVITCTAADAGFDTKVINNALGAFQSQTPLFRDNMVATVTIGPFIAIADVTNIVALIMAQITTEIARRRAVDTNKPSNATVTI